MGVVLAGWSFSKCLRACCCCGRYYSIKSGMLNPDEIVAFNWITISVQVQADGSSQELTAYIPNVAWVPSC